MNIPINIGPALLRILVLTAVITIASFAVMRPFLPATSRRVSAAVAGTAAFTVLLSLMLAGGSAIPAPAVVLVLAVTTAPAYLVLSRDERFTVVVRRTRLLAAPWVVSVSTALAVAGFARGWLGTTDARSQSVVLYTASALALAGLSWYVVSSPRRPASRIAVRVQALVLALALVAGAAHATVLRLGSQSAAQVPGGQCCPLDPGRDLGEGDVP